jgi:hypothetical protein
MSRDPWQPKVHPTFEVINGRDDYQCSRCRDFKTDVVLFGVDDDYYAFVVCRRCLRQLSEAL